MRFFIALHRAGQRIPLRGIKRSIDPSSSHNRVNFTLEAVSTPQARVPVELVLLMNLGDKSRTLESEPWTGRFTFKLRAESDSKSKFVVARSDSALPRVEGSRVLNAWAGEPIFITWFRGEDGISRDMPWAMDVIPEFDPRRV